VQERAIGVACLRQGRQVELLVAILQRVVVTSPVVVAIVILAATSVDATAVVVATSG
jgi:hypothetical protein